MRVARTRVIFEKLTGEANPAATNEEQASLARCGLTGNALAGEALFLLNEHIDIPTVWSA